MAAVLVNLFIAVPLDLQDGSVSVFLSLVAEFCLRIWCLSSKCFR